MSRTVVLSVATCLALVGGAAGARMSLSQTDDGPTSPGPAAIDLGMEVSEPLATALYLRQTRLYAPCVPGQPPPLNGCVAAEGAANANVLWELDLAPRWYIEEQRGAAALVIGGLVRGEDDPIATGMTMIDWGFAHQAQDGSFAGSSDPFHSTSFFVEAVAHTLLALGTSPRSAAYAEQINRDIDMLQRAALWMIRPDVWQRGLRGNQPYTHRRYLVAAALGETAALTGDDSLRVPMDAVLEDGLSLQRSDGVNPERGGFDSSYQAVGLEYAERWLTYAADSDPLAPAMVAMIERGLAWEATRVAPSGEVDTTGNTRTGGGQEFSRSGVPKTVAYGEVIRAFAYWGAARRESADTQLAWRIARYKGWVS